MKKHGFIYIELLLLLLGLSLLAGCGKKEEEEENTETIVEVLTSLPERRTISVSSDFSGNVQADNTIIVIPKVAGEVIEKNFEVGDHVDEGELLFAVDDTSAQIAVKQAEAALAQAKAGYTSAQANSASTIAQANENFGKIGTNEASLSDAVDKAYAGAVTAGNQLNSAAKTSDYYDEGYERAKTALSNAETARDNAKAALEAARQSGISENIALAESAYQTAQASVASAEAAKEQAKLAKTTYADTAANAEMQYYIAKEGYDAALRSKADYDQYTKNTTLYGVNAQIHGAEATLTNAETAVKQAEAALENAKLGLDYTRVTAPAGGTITAINISLHNMATQSSQAYVIQTDARNKIVFYVADETARNITIGNPAFVTRNRETYNAAISSVGDTLDSTTGLFRVEAVVEGDDSALVSGSVVSIRTVTRQSQNVIAVPINAVYYDEEQPYVYVNENNTAVRRDVMTGLSDASFIEIKAGLSEADEIISSYSSQLHDGVKITTSASTGEP